jgi:hypothetical protein
MRLFSLCFLLIPLSVHAADWNVLDSGAKPDGVTDNTEIFQKLLDRAGQAGGGIVYIPAGKYCIKGNLSIPAAVTLKGVFNVPPTTRHDPSPDLYGTVLLAYAGRGSAEGKPFIHLAGHMAVLSGVIINYPEWKQADVPPVPYPPCVLADGAEDTGVFDCCLINPYEGLRFVRSARYLVRNVFGYPSWRGFYVDECYDIGKVENCHFWPFGVNYQPDDPYCKWVNTQGVAYEFARTDWNYVTHTFCFGYGVGYKFSESKSGSCNGSFLGIGADSCQRPVLVEQAQDPGLLITNGEFVGRWGSHDSVGVEIKESSAGKVSLVNCSFWGPIDRCILDQSPRAQLTASACNFVQWDNNNQGSPAIQIDSGAAIIQGNSFVEGSLHVQVGEGVRSAILMGNQAPSGFQVENNAGTKTQMIGNEEDSIGWTEEAKKHYVIHIGAHGDGRYLRRWFGPEGEGDNTYRWTTGSSALILPVVRGAKYDLLLRARVSPQALGPEAGVYLGTGEKPMLAHFPDGQAGAVLLKVPGFLGGDTSTTHLEIRCKDWMPSEQIPGSGDNRRLGIQVYEIEVRAEGAGDRVFNANTGEWK